MCGRLHLMLRTAGSQHLHLRNRRCKCDFASVFGSLLDRKVATRLLGRYLGWICTSKWIDVYLGATGVRVFGGAQVVLLLTSQSQNLLSNVV